MSRTRFVRACTRLPPERLLAVERLRRSNPLARAALAPVHAWLRHGSVKVVGGAGHGLLLSLAHLPLYHAHAGALVRGWLEVSVQEALRRLLPPGGVLYDVGANVGFFTLLGARLAGADGHVYAVEPVPANVAAIQANAALNGLRNVTVIGRAAGSAAGRERLLLVEDLSWSHLESRGWHPQTEGTEEVEVVALDDLVLSGELRPPDVVKVDVEGSEVEVLRGLVRTLERYRPAVICELHETNREFAEAMDGMGYVLEDLEGPGPAVDAPASGHVLARPR